MTQTTTFQVEVNFQPRNDKRVRHFNSYSQAYDYYLQKCDDCNIEESRREYPGNGQEVELTAGGRGCDYRISLTESQ